MSRYVLDLGSRGARNPAVAGGKGAGLHQLLGWRFSVPPGFVVSTHAFRDFMTALGPPENGGASNPADGAHLANLILTTPIPAAIERDILRAYARLGGSVAVRSSAAGEDGCSASHAGQFDTRLSVSGEEALLEGVRACWTSLFAGRVTRYEEQRGWHGEAAMAVVVQRMAPAKVAGVAFSADPVSGQACVVIEAAPGLGTAVVGGATLTDRYVVDGRGALAEVAPAVEGRPVLREAEILRLATIAGQIERHAGRPQDIEWAWDGAEFHVLQARPITTLADRHVFSSRLVSDMAPGLVRPMVYDVNTLAKVREVFGELFGALLGTKNFDTSCFVARLYSRVYADMTVLGEKLRGAGLPPNLFEAMLRDERSGKMPMRMSPRLLGITARMILLVLRTGRLTEQQHRRLSEGSRDLELFRARDWSTVPLPEQLDALDQLIHRRNRLFWFFFCCVFNSAARMKVLRSWVERRAPGIETRDLIRGLNALKSLEPSLELVRLAEQARNLDAAAQAALPRGDDAQLRRLLGESEQGRAMLAGVDAFLERHGYLSSNGSDFSSPSWNESPTLIWRSVARGVSAGPVVQEMPSAAIRDAACARVRAVSGPVDRWVFGRLLAGATTAIDLRERASMLISQHTYQMRRLFLASARGLVERGCLSAVDDVFYLTYQEMLDLAAGQYEPAEAAARIAERRAAMAADALVEPPETIVAVPGQAIAGIGATRGSQSSEYLSGIGGSPGLVRGFARVVHDPVDAPATLCRTDILVVPFSDVGWTPLFAGIGGIVAETGGQLSHAAIVAREYGLPAVVSVRDATRRICDGQALTVDGNQGRVYLEPQAL